MMLTLVLASAATAKLRRVGDAESGGIAAAVDLFSRRSPAWLGVLLGLCELVLAAAAMVVPQRPAGALLGAVFAVFTITHLRRWRAGRADCGCFGVDSGSDPSHARAGVLTALSTGLAAVCALAAPPSPASLAWNRPGVAALVALGALGGARAWRSAFTGGLKQAAATGDRLVEASAGFLERRLSRRTLLLRIAVGGSALCVAPLRYLLYPGSALAAITPGGCSGGLCTDGYTGFCCQVTDGLNSCPEGTFPGGWWMCTDYAGRRLCAEQGVRYYVDCNALPDREVDGGCHCGGGSCSNRRIGCNIFRYGQCNTQIAGVTAVVCRMVVCENPSSIPALNCSSSLAVDNAVCGHDAPCLEPRAVELVGAGGV